MDPTTTGQFGEAWKIDLENIKGLRKGHSALAMWVIRAPWAHPMWSDYSLLVTHLRPTELLPNAKIYLPGATHEVVLEAIDPDWKIEEHGNLVIPRCLQPTNFACQMKWESDDVAIRWIELTMQDIIEGRLNPDTDATRSWIERFNDSMIKKEWK